MIDCLNSIRRLVLCAPYVNDVQKMCCISFVNVGRLTAILKEWNKLEENNVLITHILLLFKGFLYNRRNEPNRLHITALMHHIKSVAKIEQKIANEKSKLAIHFKKWDVVRHTFI